MLDETEIKSADVQRDRITDKPQVALTLTDQGGKAFASLTRTNINKQIAILVDGKVISAPVIRGEIRRGPITIEGNFTDAKAKDLANRINNAAQANKK